ncbi:GspH/FimT family pseudopilin [Colwellia piezophila]|uniref:GspH/FimT family pseudopilin n=1 Tax=Colwellia piezophila TaxID=211668 RepID=UPI00037603F0|nr:GspH/FimT family pseudopilin [Colwellia piezophila]
MLNVTSRKLESIQHPFTNNFLKRQKGITLLELMASVAITSILTVMALPNMNDFVVQMRVNSEISMLQRLLLVARNSAINSGERVIICPLTLSGRCTTDWHKELSVFIDNNNNKTFDAANNERLLVTKSAIKIGDQLIYGKGRVMVAYQPSGHLTGLSNGTFRYCPLGHEEKSRGIVIARSGRFYASSDIDNDSRDETRMNKEITCN